MPTKYARKNAQVYIIAGLGPADEHTGLYKVGAASDIRTRIRKLSNPSSKTRMPAGVHALRVYAFVPHEISSGEAAYDLEAVIHNELQQYRIRGEWFKLDQQQLEYLVTSHHFIVR